MEALELQLGDDDGRLGDAGSDERSAKGGAGEECAHGEKLSILTEWDVCVSILGSVERVGVSARAAAAGHPVNDRYCSLYSSKCRQVSCELLDADQRGSTDKIPTFIPHVMGEVPRMGLGKETMRR